MNSDNWTAFWGIIKKRKAFTGDVWLISSESVQDSNLMKNIIGFAQIFLTLFGD